MVALVGAVQKLLLVPLFKSDTSSPLIKSRSNAAFLMVSNVCYTKFLEEGSR